MSPLLAGLEQAIVIALVSHSRSRPSGSPSSRWAFSLVPGHCPHPVIGIRATRGTKRTCTFWLLYGCNADILALPPTLLAGRLRRHRWTPLKKGERVSKLRA